MASNQVVLVGQGRHEEDRASAAITPGDLIELHTSTGRKVKVHSTEGGYAELLFAKEDALQGNEIDDDYAADDLVSYHVCQRGDVMNAFLQAGQNVAIGDKLISAGDGTLQANGTEATGVTVRQIIGVAEEALDLTATGAVDTRLPVRVL